MKMTLLELVQDILSDMDSDNVNSIDDTIESEQVAQIVKTTYQSMMASRNWPHTRRTIQFTASGLTTKPTHITLQDSVKEMVFLKYNCVQDGETRKRYKEVYWVEPDDFLRILNKRNSDGDNIDVITDDGGIELLIQNDKEPKYYTSFNDNVIVFDSYDSEVDSTIQTSKIQALAYVIPTWTHSDTFTPDLPAEAFPKLLEEAKSRAMFKLKQVQDIKAEQESRRQDIWLSRKSWRVNGGIRYPNYGRKGGYYKDPTFNRDE